MRLSYKFVLVVLAALILLVASGLLFYGEQDEVTLAIPVTLEHIPQDLMTVRNAPPCT